MDKISGYIVANGQGGYDVVEKTSRAANAKPFTIPTEELIDDKPAQTQKVSAVISSTVSGTLSFYKKCDYDPFKDIAQTGNVNLPDYMQTKTTPTRSDEEILKELEELAKEHARTGQSSTSDERFLKLMDEYISSVSPDRTSILKSAVTEINGRLGNGMTNSQDYSMSDIYQQIDSQRTHKTDEDKKKEKELIDYLLEVLKSKGKNNNEIMSNNIADLGNNVIASRSDGYYTQVDIDCGGGRITSLTYDCYGKLMPQVGLKSDMYDMWAENGVAKDARIFDSNGEWVMTYDGKELSQHYTKEEDERRQEMDAVYHAAYDVASGRHFGTKYHPSEIYKEAYNSTYERLTSVSVA
jgi:hypothetical protein